MNYNYIQSDDALILKVLENKLDTSNSGMLKSEIGKILGAGKKISAFILDLTDIESCDSSGLSVLLVANRFAVDSGTFFRIVTSSAKVLNLVKITRLTEVLAFSDTVDNALKER